MKKCYKFIEVNSTFKNVIIGLLFIVLFNTFLLPILPKILWNSQVSIDEILDLKFSYSFKESYKLFDDLGFVGRKAYLKSALFIDNTYAVVYSLTYAIIIFMLLKNNKLLKYKALVILPIFIGLFDFFENFSIASMLYNYPLQMKNTAFCSSIFTSLKWSFAALVFLIVLINILILLKNKIKQK